MSAVNLTPPQDAAEHPHPTEGQITEARDLSKEGFPLRAWQVVADCSDYRTWPAGEARRLASTLASRLGSQRWSNVLAWRNWKAFPENDDYFLSAQFGRIGDGRWWESFRAIEARLEGGVSSETARADLWALQGWFLGQWRDFARAFPLLDAAIAVDPQRPWPWTEKASVLQSADRREEALEMTEQALTLHPNYRPAAQIRVSLLQELGRDEEGEEFLKSLHRERELANYPSRLHALCAERNEWDQALAYLDDVARLSPLLDKGGQQWLAARRADIYLDQDDLPKFFLAAAQTGKKTFQKRVAKHLKKTKGATHQRKRLAVPFIRQHSMTCAPATLASLAAFWEKDEDHLAIAEAICSDGTPWHKEREWAGAHGFIAREFKVTAETTKTLIDRGIPFTLTTSWTTGSHLQACIGYDEFQASAVIRDPTQRHNVEMSFEGLTENHPIQGPRGMVLVPVEREHLLAGITLPDEGVYEAHHRFAIALQEHRRPEAEAAIQEMAQVGTEDHPCVWWTRYRLAQYDGRTAEELEWLDRIITRFPKVERFRYWRLRALQRLSRREEREKSLREAVMKKGCSTVFYSELGELYSEDGRQYEMAHHFLRRAMRMSPTEEVAYATLANAKWRRFEREEALALHRISSTLSPHFEPYALEYFESCVALGKREEGLQYLQERVAAKGQKEGGPWLTLIAAYSQIGRTPEAKDKLTEACAALPENGDLLLEAAERLSYWGDSVRAWELVEQARPLVAERQWHEAVGRMAGFLGRRDKAIAAWQKVAELAPTLMPAHRALARFHEEERNGGAGAYLRPVIAEQPEHPALLGLYAEWCSADDAQEAVATLRRALAILPNWTWAVRELALQWQILGQLEEAEQTARRAVALSEFEPTSWGILGDILWRKDQPEEAEACLKKALQLDIDYNWATNHLMLVLRHRDAIGEGLDFLQEEIERQVSTGEAIFAYREHAYRHREPEILQNELKRFCRLRPDLWQTWSAAKDQALAMNRTKDATEAAEELVRRFPLTPRAYTERAEVSHAVGNYEAEIRDLQRALEISPQWDFAARRLSEALERSERYHEALVAMQQARNAEPLVAANHGMSARLLAMSGKTEEAFQVMQQAVRVDASYEFGWSELCRLAEAQKGEGEVRALLAEMDPSSRHREGWWDIKRWVLASLGDRETALAVAREALERFPKSLTLRDQLAVFLCEQGDYQQALLECQQPQEGEPWNRSLAGRHAWIQMEAGHPREAIEATTNLVAREPDYVWAWRNLMRWHSQRENWQESLEAARKVNRLDPNDAPAWGFRAEAATKLENAQEAEEALERAYHLDPDYSYGGRELLELHVNKGNYERAREIWKSLCHYSPSPYVLVDGLTIELADGKIEQVEALTDELLAMDLSEEEEEALGYAEWAFDKYRQTTLWDDRLSRHMRGDPSRAIFNAWARGHLERGRRDKFSKKLKKHPAPFDRKVGAWCLVISRLANDGARNEVSQLIRDHRTDFRSAQRTWSEAGYALMHHGTAAEAVRWFRDWRERGEALSARDYLNLASSAIRQGDLSLAAEATQMGRHRFRTGEFAESLRSVQRFIYELEGQGEEADALAAVAEQEESLPFYRHVATLADALQSARRGEPEAAEASFREVGKALQSLLDDHFYAAYLGACAEVLAPRLPKYRGRANRLLKTLQGERENPVVSFLRRRPGLAIAGCYLLYLLYRASLKQ